MKPGQLTGLTKSATDFQAEQAGSGMQIRLGPIARNLVETSKHDGLSRVNKLERAIEELTERNDGLARELAQTLATPGSADLSPLVDAIVKMNERFDQQYIRSEEQSTQFFGLFSDLNEQIYLLRILLVMSASNNGAERLDAVRTIEARMTEHQLSVMARTDLNTEKFKEMRADMDERRLAQERVIAAGREQGEEKQPDTGKSEKEAERG